MARWPIFKNAASVASLAYELFSHAKLQVLYVAMYFYVFVDIDDC
jgi:hypothetical protein